MYNCWRLVDLLVKLSVEDDSDYTPLVTAALPRGCRESLRPGGTPAAGLAILKV